MVKRDGWRDARGSNGMGVSGCVKCVAMGAVGCVVFVWLLGAWGCACGGKDDASKFFAWSVAWVRGR